MAELVQQFASSEVPDLEKQAKRAELNLKMAVAEASEQKSEQLRFGKTTMMPWSRHHLPCTWLSNC